MPSLPGTLSRQCLALVAALTVSACLSTPPTSVAKLARIDPMRADPADFRLAVRAPDALLVRDGDIKLRLSFDGGTADTRLIEEYAAVIDDASAATPGLPGTPGDGTRRYVAALTPEDAASFTRAQSRILDWRERGFQGKGSLAVSATGCAAAPFPPGPVYISTFMQTAPGDDFFALTRRVDLGKVLARAGVDGVPPCDMAG